MAKLNDDKFDMFAEPTAPRAGSAEKPADDPAASRPRPVSAKPARARTVAETPAEMSSDALGDWRWRLGASARKAVADRRRADASAAAWARLVTQARNAGVPERMLMAASLEADIDLPPAD